MTARLLLAGARAPSAAALAVAASAALALAPASARAQNRAAPVFIDGQAQVVPAFADTATWIRQQVWVETDFDTDGDGRNDRVHVDVIRPGPTGTEGLRVPVIYETSPYFAGTAGSSTDWYWNVKHELGAQPPARTPAPVIQARAGRTFVSGSQVRTWVPRGFAVVHSESPGTGLSQGCPTVGGPNESLAPKAVIDWLNGRAKAYTQPVGGEEVAATWSTGKVGMTGTSYNGTLPLAAATTGVEGLAAIIPIAPNTSYYRYYRSNGLVRSPGGYLGEDMDVLFDFISSGDPALREYCVRTVRDEMVKAHDRLTGDYNPWWDARDYWPQLGNVRAATLLAHGLNDWNVMPEHSVHVYQALKQQGTPAMLYLHQGGHGGPPPLELMNRWFTRYLYDVPNGIEQAPRAWIVREGGDRQQPTSYADYPHPDAVPVTLHPRAGGNRSGGLAPEPAAGGVRERLVDDVSFAGAALAQADSSPHRLLYATPELKEPVHISGTPRVRIRLAANRPAANLSVWLVALPFGEGPQAAFNVITRGWADPQNRGSLTSSSPLVPGEFYDLSFDLQPDDQVIPAGKRIALVVFSSDREFTLWPEPGTELMVALDGTALELPVVGGAAAFGRAVSEGSPRR